MDLRVFGMCDVSMDNAMAMAKGKALPMAKPGKGKTTGTAKAKGHTAQPAVSALDLLYHNMRYYWLICGSLFRHF